VSARAMWCSCAGQTADSDCASAWQRAVT
jgi:hypothetical protein